MAYSGLDAQAAKLVDPSTDINVKLGIIRDFGKTFTADAQRDPEWQKAATTVCPILIDTLKTGSPVWRKYVNDKENVEQVLRVQILELLHKLLTTDAMRNHLATFIPLLFDLVRNDNEELAIHVVKMFHELFRGLRAVMENHVATFMQLIIDLYNSTSDHLNELFGPGGAAMSEPDRSTLNKSSASLKVIAELQLVCLFILQTNPAAQAFNPQGLANAALKLYLYETPQEKEKDAEQMDEGDVHFGPPPSIVNQNIFNDLIVAQVKAGPVLSLVLRKDSPVLTSESWPQLVNLIPVAALRALRVMSPDAYSLRKEGITSLRHLAATDVKVPLAAHFTELLDDRILLGNLKSEPAFFISTQAHFAEITFQLRPFIDLDATLALLRHQCERLSDSNAPQIIASHTGRILIYVLDPLSTKLRTPDTPVPTEMSTRLSNMLHALLETICTRLRASIMIGERVYALKDGTAGEDLKQLVTLEQSRTVPVFPYLASENLEGVLTDERVFLRAVPNTVRLALQCIRALDGRVPDSDIMGRLFKYLCSAMTVVKAEAQIESAVYKQMAEMFTEMEPHVFQDVWTKYMGMYFDALVTQPNLMSIVQLLYQSPQTMFSLTALVLRHLVDHMETLNEGNAQSTAVMSRMYRITFMSLANLHEGFERMLLPHLTKLLIDVFPMAARAHHSPRNLRMVPYYLFRAFGNKGATSKFELLHQEIYPLLPELLDSVNRALELTDDEVQQDQLVEIALTIPVRLQYLAPFISQLWRPLVLALKSNNQEIVKQGLRTLEVAVENLPNIDLLDPKARPVARELVLALHKTLKPGNQHAETAQSATRILGKLGGRNRRILSLPPDLEYEETGAPYSIPIEFTTHIASLEIGPACEVAVKVLNDTKASSYHEPAFEFIKTQLYLLLQQGIEGAVLEALFCRCIEGAVATIHLSNMEPIASELLREVSKALSEQELAKGLGSQLGRRATISTVTTLFYETVMTALVRHSTRSDENGRRLIASIIQELHDRGQGGSKERMRGTMNMIVHIVSKSGSLCWNSDWRYKIAGCTGIAVLISDAVNLGSAWPYWKEMDICRSLVMILKDMPQDPPAEEAEVLATITNLVKFCNAPRSDSMALDETPLDEETRKEMAPDEIQHHEWLRRPVTQKIDQYIGVFATDLKSPTKAVRDATQDRFKLLAELCGRALSEIIGPAVEKITADIYSKPLRMFLPQVQVGYMEAITYLLNIDPPVITVSDELLRLMGEVIALGEMDEPAPNSMFPMQRPARRTMVLSAQTKAASIRLVTASLVITDFLSKHPILRQKATSLLFKALYSPNEEIKAAAHHGLNVFLKNQSRLPREHLQAGLRPVLMNLADPAKLTVASLEGLARLLGLLTNYFKVEIATKLLDHFKALSEDEILNNAAYGPMADNDAISKLVRLLNIFHLLPPAANTYLEQVMELVVTTETKIHAASPTPFTPPVSAYLDRFPADALETLFKHIKDARWVQTYRHIIQAGQAPSFTKALKAQGSQLAQSIENAEHGHAGVPAILICLDLAQTDPEWMSVQEEILEALKVVWTSQFTSVDEETSFAPARLVLIQAIYTVWIEVFKITPRVEILASLPLVFTRPMEICYAEVLDFINFQVANKTTVAFKHQTVQHLFTMLDEGAPEGLVIQYLRVVVLPILTAEFRQAQNCDIVVADGLIAKVTTKAWKASPSSISSALLSEYLQLTSILIMNALPRLASDTRPVVAKYVWDFLKHPEPIVRNSACLTAARLFSLKEVTSEKFQRPLWLTLLKASPDGELSPVARQALDIMTPVMPRLASPDVSLRWDQAICRTLAEEQHNLVTTVHIYRLFLRHPDQCYQSKELFVPPIAQGLTRLGFNPGFTAETRGLALDLVDLIISWHRKASEEMSDAMAVDSTSPAASWEIPTQLKENIIGYLIRFAAAVTQETFRAGLNARSLTQLKTLCGLPEWSDLNIRMSYFSRIIETPENPDGGAILNLLNCVKALNVVTTDRSDTWILQRASDLFTFTKRVLLVPHDPVLDSFTPVLDRLLDVLPIGDEGTELTGPAGDFWQWISEFIRESLGNLVRIPGTLTALLSVVKHSPSRIEAFGLGLMKLFQRLIKEHSAVLPADQAGANVQRIFSILEISKLSVRCLGDHRKQFLSGLVLLVNTTPNMELRRRLLAMAREWVMTPAITIPTTKEKASLMQKMQSWSKYNDQVYQDYLKLVYEIYSTPSMARTDLTVRLEASFILGCKAEDPALRRQFLDLFDAHIPKQIGPRLAYLLGGQGWDVMMEFNWAYVVLDIILAAVNDEAVMSPMESALSTLAEHLLRVKDILHPLRHLFYYDSLAMSRVFISLFGEIWHGLPRKEQGDITGSIIMALTKQAPQELPRNNVFQTLIAAVQRCNPPIALPPHVIKYLSKTYQSWYEGLEFLQSAVEQGREDDASVREANQDALAELYAELSEDDYYYGLWRRRCLYEETNAALSYEQNGLYQFAQPLYETAQSKARQNIYPMSEAEYYVWEDHWMLCSQKLLQWDILQDVASGEANADLALECAWRTLQTWNHDNVAVQTFINSYQGVLTPRRQLFKAYYTLYSMACTLKEQQALMAQAVAQNQPPTSRVGVMATGPDSDFARFVDEANQLSLRKWAALPEGLTQAHVKILCQFQQVVELREASLLMSNLTSTTRENLNEKATEAKGIFHHWRERLPLSHDEIDIWNDLVSWRQHVFHAVNKFYLPLSPDAPGQAASGTHIHRGHHESAWIINRFAHVARKHGLLQVCQNSLADIYKLPNIEISEAFLKLREQARCHLERPTELYQGLEVINNTNLVYFTGPQKSEFFAMKGVFLHRLTRHDDANAAFGQAVQLDISMPKAWASWGLFQDDMHHLTPTDFSLAASAVSCYLQAASLYKGPKCRPLLNRVLWLLSMDDQDGTVAQSWDKYQGEHVYWYWITFIPQLLMSLSQREGRCAHFILLGIAKTFPQALYYPLRAHRDEFQVLKKEYMQRQAEGMTGDPTGDTTMNGVDGNTVASGTTMPDGTKHSWDMAEELVALLKTGHPLLALSLEQIAEQIRERLKANVEEEAYRVTTSLLSDALTHSGPPSREIHVVSTPIFQGAQRVASSLPVGEMRTTFETQLSKPNLTMVDIVQAIIGVRDQIEVVLDRRPRFQSMEVWSHFLVEFHLNRSEKVSVPGQYLEYKDSNTHFIEIKRISTRLERCRSPISAFRRLTFLGNDGSAHMFMIQTHSARTSRREERLGQITRIFNERLALKKEAKKRNLEFNVVTTVFLNALLRLVKLDSSYVSFMDIYDEHCARNGFGREEPSLLFQEKLRTYYYAKTEDGVRGTEIPKAEYWQVRVDAKNEVETKFIPRTILSNYMKRMLKDSASLWLMRKQFTRQMSALNFLTYCMHVQVQPRRILISRQTGAVSIIDCSLVLRQDVPSLQWNDSTPFRLTPNLQTFITPFGIEGLMTSSMLALARGLLEPEMDIEKQLWLFLRDDFTTWYKQHKKNLQADEKLIFRVNVAEAITSFVKRMYGLSAAAERGRAQAAEGSSQLPTQTVVGAIQTLINLATNPLSQAKNPDQYYPWY